MNRAICTAIGSITAAQLLKVPTHLGTKNDLSNLSLSKLVSTGGMPSSHSSGVTSLATYVGLDKGFSSTDFALATMLGLIVMYDAMGIRRHAGETAIQVNDLDEDVEELAGDHPGVFHKKREVKLKESLGHQPAEVLAGALLGIGLGALSYFAKTKQNTKNKKQKLNLPFL